jgi:serpin B
VNERLTNLLALLALLVALVTGCSSGAIGAAPVIPEGRSGLSRDTSPQVPAGDLESVVAGNNAFALALHKRLVEPGKNVATSPYSISTALAMVWAGARGDTASQMAEALHFTLPQSRFHPAYDALDLALEAPSTCSGGCTPFTLRITNDAWVQKGYPFVPAYLDTLAVSYGAGVRPLDFAASPEASRQTINDAVARATEDRIRDLIPSGGIDPSTRLVLTNAVYFKGDWETPFLPEATRPDPFHLLDGSAVDVPFMNGHFSARVATQPAYDAIELPYRDSHFAMTFVAPNAGTFDAFESAFDVAALASVDAAMTREEVAVSMPKFRLTWQKRLNDALAALGMTDAFSSARADLTGIASPVPGDGTLHVSGVVHQAFVAVDEKGTEAAAATAVVAGGGGAPPPPPIPVIVDRPFLFLIRDRTTGQILFLGRVVDPR